MQSVAAPSPGSGEADREEVVQLRAEVDHLNERVRLHELAFGIANVGFWRWNLADDRVEWSDQMFEILGVDPDQFDGSLEAALEPFRGDMAPVERVMQRAMRGESSVEEHRVCRLDNQEERLVWCEGHALHDDEGNPATMVGTIVDVTEIRTMESDLNRSRERLELAMDAVDMGVWEWDMNRDVVEWSDETYRVYGVDRKSFSLGFESFLSLVQPEDREALRAEAEVARQGNGPDDFSNEYRLVADDRWVFSRGHVIRDDAGRAVRMVGVAQDISDQKRMEAEFLQSQRMESIGRLAGGIAHDFNNLLTVIMGSCGMAQQSLGETQRTTAYLETIQSTAESAARLTSQLLAFARKQTAELTNVDLHNLLIRLEPMLGRLLGDDIVLRVQAWPDVGCVRADRTHLEQVIINLVVNAREAMPEGGTIKVVATHGEDQVVVDVIDDGTGMDPQTLEVVFEPYFTTKEIGTGLGLSSCYGIIHQLGGTISATSRLGEGSQFTVTLPRLCGVQEPEVDEQSPLDRDGTGTETVLLAEDEPTVRDLMVASLSNRGYRVLEAADGAQAWDMFSEQPDSIDILVTDATMPKMAGDALAKRVLEQRPNLPVVLMSGYTAARICEAPGKIEYLGKPFTPEQLASAVRRQLGETIA